MLQLLFVTGYADSDILKHWTDLGYGTLNKPFSARDLDLAIRNTMRSAPRANHVICLPSAKA
jgi:hypothetical protein